ncbi:hypothetical protein [Bradyrhizobium canariense]|uniref:hypothetical protein n=1 Tax=Bradyrhizobium canariense TaxID=255045 RepID=UPI000A18CBE5|nr:hypothetical protein [Bradyrhizobium canariense]OSI34588.1 hypothetical protein BST65_01635 [Bradyrhizobium canariense]OSI40225.1 hypothetical protein BST66_00815 [Bradyrhizobium canariense]OSI58218.1 hypothetical protein BST67_00940 [Bradyrhizobium canariense]
MSKRTKTRDLKSSTTLSKSSKKATKMVDMEVQPPRIEPIEAVDPLVEVASIPQQLAIEASGDVVLAESKLEEKNLKEVFRTDSTGSMFPWFHQAKLLEMAEANTRFILRFVESFTQARSPNELVELTAAFSKEGAMLFQQQSNTMLKILLASPSANPPTSSRTRQPSLAFRNTPE